MRFRFLYFVLAAALIASGCQSLSKRNPSALTHQSLKIMPLGDSLTAGIDNNGAYRLPLYWRLQEQGYQFDFVGGENWGPDNLPDKDNEGHGGWRIDQVADGIEAKLSKFNPNIILLGAGGNDISQNYLVEQVPDRLPELVRRIHKHAPQSLIIVQTRPPRSDKLNDQVILFNQRVKEKLTAEIKQNSNLYLQDNYQLLEVSDIGPDHVHPTVLGNKKLAEGWFSAIEKMLSMSRP